MASGVLSLLGRCSSSDMTTQDAMIVVNTVYSNGVEREIRVKEISGADNWIYCDYGHEV